MEDKRLLETGDVIELKKGHRVYADIPKHFACGKKIGCFELTNQDIPVDEMYGDFNTNFLAGKWVVLKTEKSGGGVCDGFIVESGHKVTCQKVMASRFDYKMKVSFYQSGGFTAVILPEEIDIIGKAELEYKATYFDKK